MIRPILVILDAITEIDQDAAYKVLAISKRNPPKRLGRRSTYTPLYTIEV